MSLSNFFVRHDGPMELEGVQGATAQAQVLAHYVGSLPVQTLLNLFGQGYALVLCGHQFGGMLAHALAAKLLLMLHDEAAHAEALRHDAVPLVKAARRVVSFGFSSPLFSNAVLQQALETRGLADNLHTIWMQGDASPAFLTL